MIDTPITECVIRSFNFRQHELQDVVSLMDAIVEGNNEFSPTFINGFLKSDLYKRLQVIIENAISRWFEMQVGE